jgi:hypothetical protein
MLGVCASLPPNGDKSEYPISSINTTTKFVFSTAASEFVKTATFNSNAKRNNKRFIGFVYFCLFLFSRRFSGGVLPSGV